MFTHRSLTDRSPLEGSKLLRSPLFLKPFVGHTGLGCQRTCESPWSFPAKPNINGYFQGSSQLAEFPNLGTRTPPLFPVAHTHSASEPLIDFRDGSVIFIKGSPIKGLVKR